MTPTLPSIGTVGLWMPGIDLRSPRGSAALAAEAEALGYRTLWLSEGLVRDPFMEAGALLSGTRSLVVGTGIAVIWGRHPRTVRLQARSLLDAHPGRFVLGLGTSHARVVEGVLGLHYRRPLSALREHLDGLDAPDAIADLAIADAAPVAPRVLAALGPRALALARDRASGAITYFVTPEHTVGARAVLGPDRHLVVEQAVVVGLGTEEAWERVRAHVAGYLASAPYRAALLRLGFAEADVADDVVVPTVSEVTERIAAHLAAGADHVCLQALPAHPTDSPSEQWRRLARLAGVAS